MALLSCTSVFVFPAQGKHLKVVRPNYCYLRQLSRKSNSVGAAGRRPKPRLPLSRGNGRLRVINLTRKTPPLVAMIQSRLQIQNDGGIIVRQGNQNAGQAVAQWDRPYLKLLTSPGPVQADKVVIMRYIRQSRASRSHCRQARPQQIYFDKMRTAVENFPLLGQILFLTIPARFVDRA